MIAVFNWFLRVFKKDVASLSNIRKSRRHFFWIIGLDALLSFGVVVVGLHFFGPANWANHEAFLLKHPGLIPVPVHKFIDYATHDNETTYWLGSAKNNLYTFQSNVSGIKVVSYYSDDKKSANANIPLVTITTYRDSLVYQTATHRLLADPGKQMVLPSGETIEFDKNSMDSEVIGFQDKPVIVTIEYPTSHYETDLIVDAENLRPLG